MGKSGAKRKAPADASGFETGRAIIDSVSGRSAPRADRQIEDTGDRLPRRPTVRARFDSQAGLARLPQCHMRGRQIGDTSQERHEGRNTDSQR